MCIVKQKYRLKNNYMYSMWLRVTSLIPVVFIILGSQVAGGISNYEHVTKECSWIAGMLLSLCAKSSEIIWTHE